MASRHAGGDARGRPITRLAGRSKSLLDVPQKEDRGTTSKNVNVIPVRRKRSSPPANVAGDAMKRERVYTEKISHGKQGEEGGGGGETRRKEGERT